MTADVIIEREYSTTRIGASERAKRMSAPGFGYALTEHLVSARRTAGERWHDCRLMPYQLLTIDHVVECPSPVEVTGSAVGAGLAAAGERPAAW